MTADVSTSPNNNRRPYQDGKFIEFSNGATFLHNDREQEGYASHRANIRLFKEAIVRPETLECAEDRSQCTDDERAICALNFSFSQPRQLQFFRPKGHLLVVLISDEDERSSREYIIEQQRRGQDYSLQSCDQPEEFYRNVREHISQVKALSIHAIIIPPEDQSCLERQRREGGVGFYGQTYSDFATTSRADRSQFPNLHAGTVSSICDSNYGNILEHIASHIEQKPSPITVLCDNPVRITVTTSRPSRTLRYTKTGPRTIEINDRVAVGTKITVRTICRSS